MTTQIDSHTMASPAAAQSSARATQLSALCGAEKEAQNSEWAELVADLLADAAYDADVNSLTAAVDGYRMSVATGRSTESMEMIGVLAHALSRRFSHADAIREFGAGTLAERFLLIVGSSDNIQNASLVKELGGDETSVSRAGAKLLTAGLVLRSKAGREVVWRVTPRGRGLVSRIVARNEFAEYSAAESARWVPLPMDLMQSLQGSWCQTTSDRWEMLSVAYCDLTGSQLQLVNASATFVDRTNHQTLRFGCSHGQALSGWRQ